MAKERAQLDRGRDFSEITGVGELYRFSQDGKYFGADEVEIFPSELLDMEQAAVPDAAAKALETSKNFIARAKAEADRFKDRAATAEAANVAKDATIADLTAQLAAGQTVDVAALQTKLADVTLAGADVAGKLAEAISANLALRSEAADNQRELQESADALRKANAALAEITASETEPAATPVDDPKPPAPSAPPAPPAASAPADAPAAATAPADVPAAASAPADVPPAASAPADAPVVADAPADQPPA